MKQWLICYGSQVVNVHDGDSDPNSVMDLKWAAGRTGRKHHLCLIHIDFHNHSSVSKIIVSVHFFILKKKSKVFIFKFSTSARVLLRLFSYATWQNVFCWVQVTPTILSPTGGKKKPHTHPNNQDSVICPFSSTYLVIHTKFYGKLHKPRYRSRMQRREKNLQTLVDNHTHVHCHLRCGGSSASSCG